MVRFTRTGFVVVGLRLRTWIEMGMREWIEESRFVASLAGYALTGDTLHERSNTWPVAGARAEVRDDSLWRVSGPSAGIDGRLLDELSMDPTALVVTITFADGARILMVVPAKRLDRAHLFALRIIQASAYFAARARIHQRAATQTR